MKAVNLIPGDVRPGAGGAAGKSGGAAYAVLGALALIVAMFGAYTKTNASIDDKAAKVASVEQQASAAESHAASLASYTKFAELRTKRVATVKQLADGRFDWAHALHELARVLPANAWLTELAATVNPTVSVGTGSGTASTLRSALPVPAITMTGCTTSQASVAKMMARMRLIDGVQRVALADAAKSDTASSAGDSASSQGGCNVSSHFPTFNLVVFFEPQAGAVAPGAAGAAAGPTPAAATGGSTTPTATTGTPPTATTPTTTTAPGAPSSTPATTGVTK